MLIYEINIIGAIFCHVIKIKAFIHINPSITLGNQKWKGAAPLFSNNEEHIITLLKDELFDWIDKGKLFKYIIIIVNNKTADPIAWIKKYLREASVDIKLLSLIRGIKDNKLISKPIQALNQEFDETVIIVPNIKINKNIIFEELLKIKKKRICAFINEVWTQ